MIQNTRIMVFGTFDVLHKGHLNFFEQAKNLLKNSLLIVSVARDVNVKKIKGRKPLYNQNSRLKRVKALNFVHKAVLGGLNNHLLHILREKPAVIALGYDQKEYVRGLGASLKKRGLPVKIVRLKAYRPKLYKSSKMLNVNRD
ncbi:MAG: adenylyltransferase/cytidyltransferase family protein [Candidatus Doudnabacteria bacterium]|nr:adenylyltransferase/cytidyltransferase family protein [Candidatus Doudnabacteria bacterium]